MKPLLLSIFLLTAILQTGIAQVDTSYGKSDPEARTILKEATQKFKSYSAIKAGFTLKTTSTDNKTLGSQKGTVWIKGDKYKVQLDGQEIYCNGNTLWTYKKDIQEVQVSDYQPSKDMISPSTLFTDFYDKNFLYRVGGSSSLNGQQAHVIEMTPLYKSKPYFKVIALIGKQSKSLLSMEVFEKGGTRYTYIIDTFTPNIKLNESDFVFNKKDHPGVEVVDLR
jgi:outer membrane lipoprotein-sorting protein